jgi:glycosyltransferase involved in cell wall biosynthesis
MTQSVEERLVSIIVPVYNAQDTLERCISSILAQTWRNIEVIAVDDGSGDGSGALLDAFAEKNTRLRVVHTDNRGVSAARNTGLSLARGEYIGFADADDWMEPDMVRRLAGWLEREQADIAVCGWELHAADNASQRTGAARAEALVMTPQEAWMAALLPAGFKGYLPNKLFRASLLGHSNEALRMDEGLFVCEDLLFVLSCLKSASRVVYDPAPCYHYCLSAEGLTGSGFSPRKATLVTASRLIADLTRVHCPALTLYSENTYLTNTVFLYLLSLRAGACWRPDSKDMSRLRRHLPRYILTAQAPRGYKLLSLSLAALGPEITRRLFWLLRV